MTLSGSKGEYYVELDKNLENIVVGQILKIEKHPDADKLVICQVNVGQEEPVQIVTGAPNVFEGAVVPVEMCIRDRLRPMIQHQPLLLPLQVHLSLPAAS